MFSGNTSSAAGDAVYVEDVFSTYLYTGNGSTKTVTNGIDISTKGGLVWVKARQGAVNHVLVDTARGAGYTLQSESTTNQYNNGYGVTAFSTSGFTVADASNGGAGANGAPGGTYSGTDAAYVSWTFRKQPKFFDVVTYTGTGANQTISHNLGSVPGCIIVKRVNASGNWQVYHNGLTSAAYSVQLNLTNAQASAPTVWNSTAPTSTVFSVGTSADVNASGGTYVAYIYAHNAGGFGLTGTDNVISCGSFNSDGSGNATITLGYEPQWVLFKETGVDGWGILDTMRGWTMGTDDALLLPNLSNGEFTGTNRGNPTATGFVGASLAVSKTYIYIAIRKGPMKVPTDATTVFKTAAQAGGSTITTNFPVDLTISQNRGGSGSTSVFDRLRSVTTTSYAQLNIASTSAENTGSSFGMGVQSNTILDDKWWGSGSNIAYWIFKRAPNFFDEVCWTSSNSTNQRVSHNLTVAPELIIIKARNNVDNWYVYVSTSVLSTAGRGKFLVLNTANTFSTKANAWGTSDPTTTDFGIDSTYFSGVGWTEVSYLFATCPGVSKVGSYTGTGTLTTINCGFTGGAKFVLIKRTDTTGNWFVWDTARGMAAGTDPSLAWNTTAAESNANSVYTIATGFQLLASPSADVNTNGGTYIYLAIA